MDRTQPSPGTPLRARPNQVGPVVHSSRRPGMTDARAPGSGPRPACHCTWRAHPGGRADLAILGVERPGRPACQHVEHPGRSTVRRGRVAQPAVLGPRSSPGSPRPRGHGRGQRQSVTGPQPGGCPPPPGAPGSPAPSRSTRPEPRPGPPGPRSGGGWRGSAAAEPENKSAGSSPGGTTADARLRGSGPARNPEDNNAQAGSATPRISRATATSRPIWPMRASTDANRV